MQRSRTLVDHPNFRRALLVLILVSGTLVVHGLSRTPSTEAPGGRVDFSLPPSPAVDFALPHQAAPHQTPPQQPLVPAAEPPPTNRPISPTASAPASVTFPGTGAATADGVVRASARLDRTAVLRGADGRLYLELDLETAPSEAEAARMPTDLFVILDHSGSMSGEKIRQAKLALVDLIDQLHTGDRFALIAFSSRAETLVAPSFVDAESRRHWQRLVSRIDADGGTNMAAALDIAEATVDWRLKEPSTKAEERSCRVLLLSDGLPDSEMGLGDFASSIASRGAALSTLGIGHDFNEVLMGRLADLGTGNYYYLDRPETMAVVFAGELSRGHGMVARDLEITLWPEAGFRLVDAAGYPLIDGDESQSFRPGHMIAGQQRRFWLGLDADTSRTFDSRPIGRLELSYVSAGERHRQTLGTATDGAPAGLHLACTANEDLFLHGIDREVWARATVGESYGNLQGRVADLVRSGRRDEARQAIEGYRDRTQKLNAVVQNTRVEANLKQLEELRGEVDDAFEGADQMQKQRVMSKQYHALSSQLRRLEKVDEGGRR